MSKNAFGEKDMKMQENILKKVYEYEYKRGICYEKPDGSLYKGFRVLYILAFAFTLIINLIILLGDVRFKSLTFSKTMQASIIVCTLCLIGTFVLILLNKKMWAHIVFLATNVLVSVALCFVFQKVLRDEVGVLLSKFFYCHVVPLSLLVIFAVVLSIIAIRAEVKVRKLYNRIVEELYIQNFTIENSDLSEKEWNALLKNLWS